MHAYVQFIHEVQHVQHAIPEDLFKKNPVQFLYEDDTWIFYVYIPTDTSSLESIKKVAGELRKKTDIQGMTSLDISFDFFNQMKSMTSDQSIVAFFEGWYLASYCFNTYKSTKKDRTILLHYPSNYAKHSKMAKMTADAVCLARDLCNEPANRLTPMLYAERIVEVFKDTGVDVRILDNDELIAEGFHATYEVGKGSAHKPMVALLEYNNGSQNKMALVGKGVTFDSGGINSKTGQDIAEMKMDMGGSAAVIGAMKLIGALQLDVTLHAIIPLVENRPSSQSYLPSDVITYANGTTVEVGNTDAEGRLILADGILYAEKIGAEWIADIATLTGSIGHALGLKRAGIYSNKLNTLDYYEQISEATGDFVWPMPIIDDYKDLLESDTCDIRNIASSPYGGSITAALFLQAFVKKTTKWYHIDMANVVNPYKATGYYTSGASGFGVRLLAELIKREGICK
ncbi:M17 family metallopeptidase [Gracilibacillus marinus]|uniref:Probable cytosol aminopeptidase n=1 Tax=Gracilibacillus marinus TaxID=630535 RepID=A0ABV8VSC4_9BACI